MTRLRKAVVVAIPLVLVVAVGIMLAAARRGKTADVAVAQTVAPPPTDVLVVNRETVPIEEEVPGTVMAIQHAEISPKVMSHIQAVYVHEGDHVAKGQLLARLEGKDLAVNIQLANAGLQNSEAAYEQAKTAYTMQRTQSAVAVEQAQAALEQAQAQLAKVKQGPRPEQIRQIEEQEARTKAAYEQVTAYLDLTKEGARAQQKRQVDQAVIAAQQQVAQAEAGLSAAKAQLQTVQNDYNRIQNLYSQDILPRQKLDYATAQLEAAKSGVRQAEAAVNAANANLEMAREGASMVHEGARTQEILAAEKQVEQARAAYEQAKQETVMAHQGGRWEDIKTAQEGVTQAEQALRAARAAQARDQVSAKDITRAAAGIAQARAERVRAGTMLGYTNIYAPFSGVITGRKADPGNMAMSQMPILSIDDDSRYQLVSSVPENTAAHLAPGKMATVVLSALNTTLQARIEEIVPSANPATRTLTVKVILPRTLGLQSGLFGRLKVTTGQEQRLLVPREAVVERNGLTGVYMVDADQQQRYTLVTLGKEDGDRVQVLSGLGDGQKIIAHAKQIEEEKQAPAEGAAR